MHQKLLCSPPGGGAALTDAWCMWGRNTIEFSIPDGIEPGEYLIRAEHIGLHGAHDNNAEFYFSCAQVNLGGSGTGGASSSGSTEGTTSTNSTGSSTGYAPPTTSAAPSTDYSAPASDYNV
ncbi:MAG: hypothetical protein INR62_12855, partial [Rhodospirillales bacterium]|nr:hypothetical protein [Acetobacter sp.]